MTPDGLPRREFLKRLGLGAAATALPRLAWGRPARVSGPLLPMENSAAFVRLPDGSFGPPHAVRFERTWRDGVCRARLLNRGAAPLAIRDIVLAAGPHGFGPDTPLYGEGFQMLSQTAGTLAQPRNLGYSEAKHYRLPQVPGATTVRSFALLSPAGGPRHLAGFASCRRFAGEIRLYPGRFEFVLDGEGRELAPGAAWDLEELVHFDSPDREALLDRLAARIAVHHPRLPFPRIPTGWCSWYYYGKRVTERDVLANLVAIAGDRDRGIDLQYVQIDDGYQPAHGDWLDPNPRSFPGGIRALCGKIRARGFQPAIWVAPFIAAPESRLLREHPDWFVQDGHGRPLSSGELTFRGWDDYPWYMLDATMPAVQAHLEHVFRVMREQWGVTYFKLDANLWGAVRGCRYRDPAATRIQNYRRGMAAIRRGAGPDGFLLGCNAPMWGSLGTVHGMRVTSDIRRAWRAFANCAHQLFPRNWQHGRLWDNDPDCLLVSKHVHSRAHPLAPVTDDEMRFHASVVVASGGLTLDGDDYTALTPAQKGVLRRALPPTGRAARFARDDFQEGRAVLPDGRTLIFVFNWNDAPRAHRVALAGRRRLRDFWTEEDLGVAAGSVPVDLSPHDARILVSTPA